MLNAAPSEDAPDAPGLLLLSADGAVESQTPQAQAWLRRIISSEAAAGELPGIVHSVAYRALLAARGGASTGARARVPVRGGPWIVLHGSVVGDPADGRTAVILEPATGPELAPLIVAAYALTQRERDVAQLVLQGLSTAEIARRLCLSEYTVQDHLKAIFDKVGVRTRRELVAQIFFQHYVPRLHEGTRISSSGWFAE